MSSFVADGKHLLSKLVNLTRKISLHLNFCCQFIAKSHLKSAATKSWEIIIKNSGQGKIYVVFIDPLLTCLVFKLNQL